MIPQIMPPGGQRSKPRPIFPGMQNQNPQGLAKPGVGSIGGPGGVPQSYGPQTDGPGIMPPVGGYGGAGMGTSSGFERTPAPMPSVSPLSGQRPNASANPLPNTGTTTPLASQGPMPSVTPGRQGGVIDPGRNPHYGTPGTTPPVQGGGNVNPAWNPQGGVSPFDASSGSTGIGDFQRFSDAAYERQAGRLTPQFEAQQRSFEQDMVNRGIAAGTPAYDNARQNFENSRNDAFEGARTQADQLGAALQQQSFGQGQVNSQGLRELILGQLAADTSRQNTSTSAAASRYGADSAANTSANNLAFQQQQGDFGNLMQLLGFGLGATGQNNAAQGQNYNQNAGMLGMIPGMQQPNNLDVTSGYNNQYNAGLNNAQYNQQQQNANNQMYAQMFASLYCDRNAKDEIAAAAPEDALTAITGLPYAAWTYKADVERVPHVGTYAQDFNEALGLPANLHISPIDLMGALIGSVQALAKQNEELRGQVKGAAKHIKDMFDIMAAKEEREREAA